MLGTADVFENLGVAAYNGAGKLIKNVDYLAAAGSIVSVEARHAAAIAELIGGASAKAAGGGHVDSKGLDGALSPAEVLPKAAPFIKTPVTANVAGLRRSTMNNQDNFILDAIDPEVAGQASMPAAAAVFAQICANRGDASAAPR